MLICCGDALPVQRKNTISFLISVRHHRNDALSSLSPAPLQVFPLSAAPEPKRRFLPSKWEMMKVGYDVMAMVDATTKRHFLLPSSRGR